MKTRKHDESEWASPRYLIQLGPIVHHVVGFKWWQLLQELLLAAMGKYRARNICPIQSVNMLHIYQAEVCKHACTSHSFLVGEAIIVTSTPSYTSQAKKPSGCMFLSDWNVLFLNDLPPIWLNSKKIYTRIACWKKLGSSCNPIILSLVLQPCSSSFQRCLLLCLLPHLHLSVLRPTDIVIHP